MSLVVFANENRFARGITQNESGRICRKKLLAGRITQKTQIRLT
jgi:hypothetical protein